MSDEIPFLAPPPDDELPPPPKDIAEQSKSAGETKIKKPKPLSTIRRAFIIFEKDLRTMAKHGLISALILFVFLAIVFYIMSFTMEQAVKFDFGGGDGDGGDDGGGIPAGTGVNVPVAHMSIAPTSNVAAGTSLTLDATASTDNSRIEFYVWEIDDGYQEQEVFGSVVHHTFNAVGNYEVHLTVVDDEWNMNETASTVQVSNTDSDTEAPTVVIEPIGDLTVGMSATFDASNSTDNVGIVDYTWLFEDGTEQVLHNAVTAYTFHNAGYFDIELIVRDASGNIATGYLGLNVQPNPGDDEKPEARTSVPPSVDIGDEVQLDASDSNDNQGHIRLRMVRDFQRDAHNSPRNENVVRRL